MSDRLPIQYSAHHASHNFGEFSARTALTPEQRERYSDYGTDYTVPTHGAIPPLFASYSRGVVDLNRAPDAPTLFPQQDFSEPTPNKIWQPGAESTQEERAAIFQKIYRGYHDQFLANLRMLESRKRPIVVVAWDNTGHYEIGKNESGEAVMMKSFILSNKGSEGSSDSSVGELTTCDPNFLDEFAHQLRISLKNVGLPDEVFLNLVYKGGYIPEHYNTRRHPELAVNANVQSFQVEYDTILTHDQENLTPDFDNIVKIRIAFERAMNATYINLIAHI